MISARVAAAAFVLGISLSGPHTVGVAAADNDADAASGSNSSAAVGQQPGGNQSGAAQRGRAPTPARPDSPAPGSRRPRSVPQASAEPSAEPDDPPARDQAGVDVGLAAVDGVRPSRRDPAESPSGPASGSEAIADATAVSPSQDAEPTGVPGAGARPAAAAVPQSGGGPATGPAPEVPVTGKTAPAVAPPAVAPPAEMRVTAALTGALERLVDSVGNWLATLPVTPFTDVMGGALWLVRRAVVPVGSGLWSPALCAACTAQLHSPSGQVLTVTNRVDGEAGSLRDVLSNATAGDVIRFSPLLSHATLTLTQGALEIDTSIRIEGSQQTLDAAGRSRIMVLDKAGTSIALSGLNFANGSAPGDPGTATAGGAILADSVTLDICRARFSGNSAVATDPAEGDASFMQSGLGGAVAAFGSTVTVSDSDFGDNRAAGADNNTHQQPSSGLGGAIFAENSAVTLRNTRFTGNSATGGSGTSPIAAFFSADGGLGAGGAVFASGGSLSATGVTFAHNSARGGDGLDGSASNPYGNGVGGGGNASGGALWMVGPGRYEDPIPLDLTGVLYCDNTATGGSAGAQGLPTLAAQQGGRASGGGFGAVEWVAVTMDDVTLRDNIAQGGGAGANASAAGNNTGTGGVAQGGGALLVSPSSIQATHLSVRHNTARGGRGADAPDSGTEAGEGGYAYGGGVLVNNATGSLAIPALVIPVGIRQAEFVDNSAAGGEAGTGPVPASGLGAGGLAQGGGLDFTSLFETRLVGVRFIGNTARAGQGKSAAGGALINPFSVPNPGEIATLQIQNSLFRGNTAVGGDDAANVSYRETKGGGFYNLGLGTVVSGSWFAANRAVGGDDTGSGHLGSALGGAIYSEASRDPSIAIFNTTFADNSALGGRRRGDGESLAERSSGEAHGGALYAANGTTTVNGGAFVGNQAVARAPGDHTARGGAIEIAAPAIDYTNYLATTGVRFTWNQAVSQTGAARGGAVAFNGDAYVDDGSRFFGNAARSGWGTGSAYGGALYLERASTLNGTAVTDNRAVADQGFGGGIALPNGPQVLTRVQTDVRGNSARTAGNNVWWPDGAPPTAEIA